MRSISIKSQIVAGLLAFVVALVVGSLVSATPQASQFNPITQIDWVKITGAGSPTFVGASCSSSDYGRPFEDTSTNPNNQWVCSSHGWEQTSGIAGGDLSGSYSNLTVVKINGAALPTNVAGLGANGSGQLVAVPHPIAFQFGTPGGPALSTGGVMGYWTAPYACTITGWSIETDVAGSATVDFWVITSGTAVPTIANSITASAQPAISTGTVKQSTTLTGWATNITANSIIAANLKTVSGVGYVDAQLVCQ